MVRNCNRDAESAVELRHGDGGGGAHRVSSSFVKRDVGVVYVEKFCSCKNKN